ncbi:MAG TPA: acyl-CoA dehydrogenase family protein [Rhizomicrobium sp.]|nr:acyl-CoA dehydrogenase family protein [Rhizomicrobium sp.]
MSMPIKARMPMTEAELMRRARELVPVVAGRAADCEEQRRVPDETVADFEKAGFYRIVQPSRYGGYEMSPLVLFRVAMEIARGCPSSAWCLCVVGIHNWELALLDPRAAEDVWGKDPDTRISSSYAPFGTVEKAEGGFYISGRWPWSSGCDHCSWAFLGGLAPAEGPAPDMRAFLIPRSDYEIVDDWHVIGLKGTGSKEIVVKRAFVPDYRTHRFSEAFLMQDPGRKEFTAPCYRYPFGIVFAYCLASVVLGMADGAVETFCAQMKSRRDSYTHAASIEDPFVRQRVAEADAIVRGLHARLETNFADMTGYIARGEPIPLITRVNNKWDAQTIGKDAMRAIELMFKASGGRGLRLSNPMQRYFRDAHAASNHAYLNADKGSLNAGFVAMGGETMDFSI